MIQIAPFSSCDLILTEDCNLRCKYCFEKDSKYKKSYMSYDTAKQAADFLFNNAFKHHLDNIQLNFTGGEPLLNLDVMIKFFRYAVEKANKYNMKVSFLILTNGTIYNKQFEEFILEWYKAIKHVNIQISIDGVPESHDKNRTTVNGKSTSGIVLENAIKLKMFFEQNNIENKFFNTNSVFTKDTISKIFLSYKYLQQLDMDNISFAPSRYEEWEESDLSIYAEQLALIADFVYNKCIESGSIAPYKKTDRIFGLRLLNGICKSNCATRRSECAIAPNGDVYPRASLYFSDCSFKLGTVFDGIIDNNNMKSFFDTCQGNVHVNNIFCDNCEIRECNIYMKSNYVKWNETREAFLIETRKRFDKLSDELYYSKCNEMSFFKAIN